MAAFARRTNTTTTTSSVRSGLGAAPMATSTATSRYAENARVTSSALASKSTVAATRTVLGDRTNTATLVPLRSGDKGKSEVPAQTTSASSGASSLVLPRVSSSSNVAAIASDTILTIDGELIPRPAIMCRPNNSPHADIDIEDRDDPQAATEYIEDIMCHLRAKEIEYACDPNYLSRQADVSEKFRAILIDWLVDVHLRFKLVNETLYLTVNILDRFLAKKQVSREKLQLVGSCAMLIAAKYEEICPPEIRDFEYVCDGAFKRAEFLKTEQLILAVLNFNLLAPYPIHFLRRFSKAAKVHVQTHSLAKYIIELTLIDYACVAYLPSTIAAAALCVAMRLTGAGDWNSTLVYYSQYTEEALEPVIATVDRLIAAQAAPKKDTLTAITKKYKDSANIAFAARP